MPDQAGKAHLCKVLRHCSLCVLSVAHATVAARPEVLAACSQHRPEPAGQPELAALSTAAVRLCRLQHTGAQG